MADRELQNFVSDECHKILGYSDKTVVQYIIALGKSAKSVPALVEQLKDTDLPDSDDTKRFASQLFAKMPRRAPAAVAAASQPKMSVVEQKSLEIKRKNETYKLLLPEEEDETDHLLNSIQSEVLAEKSSKEKKSAKEAKKHVRKKREEESESDEEQKSREKERERSPSPKRQKVTTEVKQEQVKKEKQEDGGSDVEEFDPEAARLLDLKERDEFDERLKKKDRERTKRAHMTKAEIKAEEEAKIRELVADTEKDRETDKRRDSSRREYLVKREKQKVDDLRREIADEERMFRGEKLTKDEMRELELKKEQLRLAEEHYKTLEKDLQTYLMPESYYDEERQKANQIRRMAVLTAKQQEAGQSAETSEQHQWERGQIGKALPTYGALDRKQSSKEYTYVFDEEVEFISEGMLAGEGAPAAITELSGLLQDDTAAKATESRKSEHEKIQESRKLLPIFAYREEFLKAMEQFQVVVLVGETGSGKTTQIPQYLHEAGYTKRGKIGCTQPRRVAAMSVAARVAQEMDVRLGKEVGYSIRFEDCCCEDTIVKYMTDGMLLREFLGEPDLASYSVMIIDEAHERSLHTDILFGLIKDIARFRDDIKIIISSATLQAEKFSKYFDDAPVFNVPGRRYPVDIMYTKAPEADYVQASVVSVLQLHITQPAGDILVFLTGQDEIEEAEELLKQRTRGLGSRIKELIILPIYSTLPTEMQAEIFKETPPNSRKVILSTNIAETSLTINGIVYVVDCGYVKQKNYNPRSGMESLQVVPITRASAQQRAGRAGRTAPGKCYRLYTAWTFKNDLEENPVPEIQRTNLGNVVLMLKSLGINDLLHFDFMDPPPVESLLRALEQLYALGALNDRGELTKLGRRMAEFPLDPMLSKMLIASEKYKCSDEIVSICSMLSVNNAIFYRPKDKALYADAARKAFFIGGGDHTTLLNVFNQWRDSGFGSQFCYENFVQFRSLKRARDVRDQLVKLMERVEIELVSANDDYENIRKAITAGYFFHTAQMQKSGNYRTVKNPQSVHIHPSSALFQDPPKWVVYFELVFTSKEFMRSVIEINPAWLREIAPHYYSVKELEGLEGSKKMPKKAGKSAEQE